MDSGLELNALGIRTRFCYAVIVAAAASVVDAETPPGHGGGSCFRDTAAEVEQAEEQLLLREHEWHLGSLIPPKSQCYQCLWSAFQDLV